MYVQDANLGEFVRSRLAEGCLTVLSSQAVHTERRREERYGINQRALMHTVYPVSSRRRVVRLLDVSGGGLLAEAAVPELIGSSVRVYTDDVFISGEIRHCREIDDKCLIGIRIDGVLYELESAAGNGILEYPRVFKRAG